MKLLAVWNTELPTVVLFLIFIIENMAKKRRNLKITYKLGMVGGRTNRSEEIKVWLVMLRQRGYITIDSESVIPLGV